MISKVIDKFFIDEHLERWTGYVARENEINIQYVLNVGDKVYEIKYEGRGTNYKDVRILSMNDKGICIYHPLFKEVLFLNWIDKDERQLEYFPFYEFKKGINDKNFIKKITKTIEDFQTAYEDIDNSHTYIDKIKCKKEIETAKSYVQNYKNVLIGESIDGYNQLDLFESIL